MLGTSSQQGSHLAKWVVSTVLRRQRPRLPIITPRIQLFQARPLFRHDHQINASRCFSAQPSLEIDEDDPNLITSSVSSQDPSNTPLTLRPYQQTAIDKCLQALSQGLTRIGVSSPTGSGKTTVFMSLIPHIPNLPTSSTDPLDPEEDGERNRTLILVGSVELANQAEKAARRLLPHLSVEVEQSKRVATGRADVTIATYQTLNNVDRLRKFDPSRFKLIIVDEAHHAAAVSYLRLLHYFNDEIDLPDSISPITSRRHGIKVPIIGFSATFSRPDQLALGAVFQEIVFHRDITSMLQEKWLSPVKAIRLECDLDLDNVEENERGDFRTSSLAERVDTPEINELIVRTYLHRAEQRRTTLIFCVNLKHVAHLTQTFREAGIDARSVSSQSDPRVRKETIAAFGKGQFSVLINCEVLTEGTDIPEIDYIILARPTKSRNLLAQMVGRGLRLSPETGKIDCLIVDIVDTMSKASGLIVSPTLFGLTHDELDDERILKPKDDKIGTEGTGGQSRVRKEARDFKVTFHDEDDPFGVGVGAKPLMVKVSPNAWKVACGNDRYVLELFTVGDLTIEPTPKASTAAYNLKFRQKIPKELSIGSPYRKSQLIAQAEDLERAFLTGDKFAERRVGRDMGKQLSRYAPWRQRSASAAQMKLLMKMKGVQVDGGRREVRIFGKVVDLGKVTAGQVSSYLCAASHGAATVREKNDKSEERRAVKLDKKVAKLLAAKERDLPLPADS